MNTIIKYLVSTAITIAMFFPAILASDSGNYDKAIYLVLLAIGWSKIFNSVMDYLN